MIISHAQRTLIPDQACNAAEVRRVRSRLCVATSTHPLRARRTSFNRMAWMAWRITHRLEAHLAATEAHVLKASFASRWIHTCAKRERIARSFALSAHVFHARRTLCPCLPPIKLCTTLRMRALAFASELDARCHSCGTCVRMGTQQRPPRGGQRHQYQPQHTNTRATHEHEQEGAGKRVWEARRTRKACTTCTCNHRRTTARSWMPCAHSGHGSESSL